VSVVQAAVSVAVAFLAVAVVRTRDPLPQLMLFSIFGTSLALFFFVLQAPDVALSEMAVGAVAYPIVVLVALAKAKRRER